MSGARGRAEASTGTYRVICAYHPQMKAALRITG